jgi:hypothetical protein
MQGSGTTVVRVATSTVSKVKSHSLRYRLVIALISPNRIAETGPPARSTEKKPAKFGNGAQEVSFSGLV